MGGFYPNLYKDKYPIEWVDNLNKIAWSNILRLQAINEPKIIKFA